MVSERAEYPTTLSEIKTAKAKGDIVGVVNESVLFICVFPLSLRRIFHT